MQLRPKHLSVFNFIRNTCVKPTIVWSILKQCVHLSVLQDSSNLDLISWFIGLRYDFMFFSVIYQKLSAIFQIGLMYGTIVMCTCQPDRVNLTLISFSWFIGLCFVFVVLSIYYINTISKDLYSTIHILVISNISKIFGIWNDCDVYLSDWQG